jgi:hypothetical protein
VYSVNAFHTVHPIFFEARFYMDKPDTLVGAFTFIVFGTLGTITALLIAQYFPSLIPASASGVRF